MLGKLLCTLGHLLIYSFLVQIVLTKVEEVQVCYLVLLDAQGIYLNQLISDYLMPRFVLHRWTIYHLLKLINHNLNSATI